MWRLPRNCPITGTGIDSARGHSIILPFLALRWPLLSMYVKAGERTGPEVPDHHARQMVDGRRVKRESVWKELVKEVLEGEGVKNAAW